ncbi:hypothetical protein ES706_03797 [subsurface metagenome]
MTVTKVGDDYKCRHLIPDRETLYKIFQKLGIKATSYGKKFYGKDIFKRTFERRDKIRGGKTYVTFSGRFYLFLNLLFSGFKETITYKDMSGIVYIENLEYRPSYDIHSGILEGAIDFDHVIFNQDQNLQITKSLLTRGYIEYIGWTKKEQEDRTMYQNFEIVFKSCNYAAKEIYDLVIKGHAEYLNDKIKADPTIVDERVDNLGELRDAIIKQIITDMVNIKPVKTLRLKTDGPQESTTVSTIRKSLEDAIESWKDPSKKDINKLVVYVKIGGEIGRGIQGYWVPISLVIKDRNKFLVSEIVTFKYKFLERKVEQDDFENFIKGEIDKFLSNFDEYIKNGGDMDVYDWLIKDRHFYLSPYFKSYIDDQL